MRSIRKFLAIMLLALTLGLGAPAAMAAEGTAESPGVMTEQQEQGLSATVEGTAESPGIFGTAESPGFMATFLIYMDIVI